MIDCRNPGCKARPSTFTTALLRKELIAGVPYIPVQLQCSNCGQRMRTWVMNAQLKEIYKNLHIVMETNKMIHEEMQTLKPFEERKSFVRSLRERLKRRSQDGKETG